MLEVDKLILTAIEKNCIDVVELLLKNRDKLRYGNWSGDSDGQEWRSDLLGKTLELEKANPSLPLKEDFLKKAKGLFNAGDVLYLYLFPDNFDPMDIPKDLIKHCLNETPNAKGWIDEETEGYCALSRAVCSEDKEMAELLLEYGADANIHASDNDDYYGTVLGLALKTGNQEIIKLLLRHGASVSDLIASPPECFECDNSPLMLLKNILSDMRRFEDIGIVDKVLP